MCLFKFYNNKTINGTGGNNNIRNRHTNFVFKN